MRSALFALALAAALPLRAFASLPSPANSTVPAYITLVGSTGGVPAQVQGQFQVVYRDLANDPIPTASIVVDLSNCFDLVLCADQRDPAVIVDCPAKRASGITDANGSVRMTLLGASTGPGNATTLLNGGRIYANGMLLGSPTLAAFDLDGASGVGAGDLAAWLGDFVTGAQYGRSDYDGDGSLGAGDLSLWLRAFASGEMVESCAGACP